MTKGARDRMMEAMGFLASEEKDEEMLEEINASLKGILKSIQDQQTAALPLLESISTSLAKMSEYLDGIDDKLGYIDEKLEKKQ